MTCVTTANVTVTVSVPVVNIGDFLSSVGLTQQQIDQTPKEIRGEPLGITERMMIFLRREHGKLPPFRKDLEPFPLPPTKPPGTFVGRFQGTEIEGYYQFTAVASGIAECDPFRRETVHGLGIGMKLDEDNPKIEIVPNNPGEGGRGITVTVTPGTSDGSLVGPGHSDTVVISADGFLTATSGVIDNLNGSYSQSFVASDAHFGIVSVGFGDLKFASIPLSLTVPVIASSEPESILAGTDQPLILRVGEGSLKGVTGVVLASDHQTLSLQEIIPDKDAQSISVPIPKGTPPGYYSVYLESDGLRGPSSPTGFLQIIDPEQKPSATVRAFNARLATLKNAESRTLSTKLIPLMLRDLRDAAVRREIPMDARNQRLKALLGALVSKEGERGIEILPLKGR